MTTNIETMQEMKQRFNLCTERKTIISCDKNISFSARPARKVRRLKSERLEAAIKEDVNLGLYRKQFLTKDLYQWTMQEIELYHSKNKP